MSFEDRPSPPISSLEDLLREWLLRVERNIETHNLAETRTLSRDRAVGAFGISSLLIVGGLAGFLPGASDSVVAIVAVVVALAGLFGGLQAHFNWREQATSHRAAARQYAALRRSIELAQSIPLDSDEAIWRRDEIRRSWDAVAAFAPNASAKIREEAKRRHPRPGVAASDPEP